MKILVACEESQRVCIEFRRKGHESFSCDLQKCTGGHPEWHIMCNVLDVLNGGIFKTMDNIEHIVDRWDMIIAFPPCTYLSSVSNRAFSLKSTPAEKVVLRWENRALAAVFFMQMFMADCDKIAVENPKGFMSKAFKKPTQYIHPYMFAESVNDENYCTKQTGLWLKGLPGLVGNGKFKTFDNSIFGQYSNGKNKNWEDMHHGSIERSKTFPGIAKAMADQWG